MFLTKYHYDNHIRADEMDGAYDTRGLKKYKEIWRAGEGRGRVKERDSTEELSIDGKVVYSYTNVMFFVQKIVL